MHPVMESLMEAVERDPYPTGHATLYWQREGERLKVKREGDLVSLRGFGVGTGGAQTFSWKVIHALERLSYREVTERLKSYAEIWSLTRRLARGLSQGLTFDVWKSAVIVATLADHWAQQGLSPRTFAVIGDGDGFLSALVRQFVPQARIYCIDLPKGLVFQAHLHHRADKKARLTRLRWRGEEEAEVVFVLPQEIEQIPDPIDCAVNIASMQEMSAASIASYFKFLRQRSLPESRFYCVNRLEKPLPGVEAARFLEYPWAREDAIFLDGPCPYYTHYVSRLRSPRGVSLLGARVPFLNRFDGPMVHRLAHLACLP